MFRKSLQTITWGDTQSHLFDDIFRLAAEVGFEGVEIGFRHLCQVSITDVRDLLHKHQITLSACHIRGNLGDHAQESYAPPAIETAVDYLVALNCDYLLYSGLNTDNDGQLMVEISILRDIANVCAEHGKKVLYHNHDWEFKNARRIWSRLLDANIEGLGFAPDLGWLVKGDQGMGALLDEIGSSVETLHFKNFVSWDDGQNTCHLDDGVVDFTPAWEWLSYQTGRNIWLTAEQDNAVDAEEACRHNGSTLASHLANLEGSVANFVQG